MNAVDQHAEAHRLRAELGWGERRIAERLAISRYAAKKLLERPLAEPVPDASGRPVAEVADQERPVAVATADVADQAAGPVGQERPLAEPVADQARPVAVVAARAAGPAATAGRPVPPAGPWLRINLGRSPALWRALIGLLRVGLQLPAVVDLAVRSFAAAYHHAVMQGEVRPGQPYEVQTTVRACQHWATQ